MKIILISFLFCIAFSQNAFAQTIPADLGDALNNDDSTQLSEVMIKDSINSCYGYYSLLSHTIRINAVHCFNYLINNGADVNKICGGYVPPLMHAAKYDRLDMVKLLIAKGANLNYVYHGPHFQNGPEENETAISYAERFGRKEVVIYLKSLQKNN